MEILLGVIVGVVLTAIAGTAWFMYTFKDFLG